MTHRMLGDTQLIADCVGAECVGDVDDGLLAHATHNAKLLGIPQANNLTSRQNSWHSNLSAMDNDAPRPFSDIAERLLWHRQVMRLTQKEYAESFGQKRSAYSLWEGGTHRLSLDAALSLRNRYGLSLDFMYEGIDDALPMTLRNAWRDRP